MVQDKKIKVLFFVEKFPVISEPFIIEQAAELLDRGVDLTIFSLKKGDSENISKRFYELGMDRRTIYADISKNYFKRIPRAFLAAARILFKRPLSLIRSVNFIKYRRDSLSLRLIIWADIFLNLKTDLVHCHFGTTANKFILLDEVLGNNQKFVTTFYGYDASRTFKEEGEKVYNKLKERCASFFVMSNSMKDRLVAHGFDENRLVVNPIGVDVDSYEFKKRDLSAGEPVKIISVGRFVEKKGFDDLLNALAIVKEKTDKKFACSIVGDGPLKDSLRKQAARLGIDRLITWEGYMRLDDIISSLYKMHFFVQPSKTAKDGNME